MSNTNPLLQSALPLSFDRITAAHVEPGITALLDQAAVRVKAIGAAPGARTYANTLGALEAATEQLEVAMGVADHLESVLGDPALRTAYNAVLPKVSAFYSSLPLDAALYSAIKAFAQTSEAAGLEPTRRRFLDKTLDDFRRHGAELPPEKKARLEAIEVELSERTTRFAQNVVDETDAWEFFVAEEARLDGLPESAKQAARASAEGRDQPGWRFTLHAPSYTPVLQHLKDAEIRAHVWRAANTRATSGERNNAPHIARVLTLRHEKAELLGYKDVSDLLLEPRMVKTGAAARAFVEDLARQSEPAFEAEQISLLAFRRTLEGPEAPPPAPWDLGYYSEKQRRATCAFDAEALRAWFKVETVLHGLWQAVERLYGVRVAPLEGWPTWHPEVTVYSVDDADGTRLGVFYADLFPREGKRGGAWMRPFVTGVVGETPHVAVMCANLTPALGERPALLSHREVETLFHEFGHLLHHLLTKVEVRSLAGTNVAWDFVELPSQIMENWCWAREALDLFARHHETGEPIPDDLYAGLQKARTFRGASAMMRQLGYGAADLALHQDWRSEPPLEFARHAMARFTPAPLPDDYGMIASFTHLFGSPTGYAAGYYSYKWAEVLDADAFTRFEAEGLFSREVGESFRRNILEMGDARDPAALYQAFMGRAPDPKALFIRAGLA
jgi:oligopeptidase A